ncbi:hypothetical protein [Cellvibrio mixtus]|uniref:hypothetical protein n=1 Tax=Cellvibrio mixtus TaxID=39650 RepID=UPI0005876DF7|nr:hypothetical protein [Cellvibrio mixtus]
MSISKSHRLTIGLFVGFAILLWLPSLFIPWWGDDYFFLNQARESHLNNNSWWLPFITPSETGFWRPLSMDTGWRVVEELLHGNLLYAHLFSWLLCLFSAAAVAGFVYQIAVIMRWQNPIMHAVIVTTMHAVHVASYLPLHWVSAMNSPVLVFFLCVTLTVWIVVPTLHGWQRLLGLVCLPLLQLLSLFSKEVAILIPLLVVIMAIFLQGKQQFRAGEIIIWLVCVVICLVWLYFYQEFTPNRHSAYGITAGKNLIINSFSFLAWLFNIPREALRMIVLEQRLLGVVWAIACFIPLCILYWISVRALKPELKWIQWCAALAFIVVAYGPYFVLANQAYEYYAAVAVIFPLLLITHALIKSNQLEVGLILIGISSLAAIQGTRSVDYPAIIGRAYWAEQQIQWIKSQPIELPLVVTVTNEHQFAAIGVMGLSWRLGVPIDQIVLGGQCVSNVKKRLVQNPAGDFEWKICE